jgi:excisionase family DNA binding protein
MTIINLDSQTVSDIGSEWLTVAEVAAALRTTPPQVYRWCRAWERGDTVRGLRSHRLGTLRGVRIKRAWLEAFTERRSTPRA